MEGSESLIYSSPSSLFYGRGKNCKMSMVDAYEHPSRVKGGQKSLQIMGQTKQKATIVGLNVILDPHAVEGCFIMLLIREI